MSKCSIDNNRYEQVCQRIQIHNCRASRTLQRRVPKDIWLAEQVQSLLCCGTTSLYSAHTTPEKYRRLFWIRLLEKLDQGNHVKKVSWRQRSPKAPFSKCIPFTLKREDGVFKFLLFEERVRKTPFPWQVSVDSPRPNRAVDGVMWKLHV